MCLRFELLELDETDYASPGNHFLTDCQVYCGALLVTDQSVG
jgi:hypothetical protein